MTTTRKLIAATAILVATAGPAFCDEWGRQPAIHSRTTAEAERLRAEITELKANIADRENRIALIKEKAELLAKLKERDNELERVQSGFVTSEARNGRP
jgi:hypothetical protein